MLGSIPGRVKWGFESLSSTVESRIYNSVSTCIRQCKGAYTLGERSKIGRSTSPVSASSFWTKRGHFDAGTDAVRNRIFAG